MNVAPTSELIEFHRFLGEKIERGGQLPTLEAALDEWDSLHPVDAVSACEDDLEAIQEALDDIEAGDEGIPFEEFKREFLAKHQLPAS